MPARIRQERRVLRGRRLPRCGIAAEAAEAGDLRGAAAREIIVPPGEREREAPFVLAGAMLPAARDRPVRQRAGERVGGERLRPAAVDIARAWAPECSAMTPFRAGSAAKRAANGVAAGRKRGTASAAAWTSPPPVPRSRAMNLRFHKMHGLGNDFVVIDARTGGAVAITPARARAIADRHTGVGCDQLILVEPSQTATARMRIWNADGSEVEACGNASRCVAMLLGGASTIETRGGLIAGAAADAGATVDMGEPRFGWEAIPLAYAMDTAPMPLGWEALERPHAVNVGNPHAIFFVTDTDAVDLARLGPVIEQDPVFPARVNVNVATVEARDRIRLRVWERGAGLTRACGTGACATAVAAIRAGLADGPATVVLPGGSLVIDWRPGDTIRMTGPASHVFTAQADLEAFG